MGGQASGVLPVSTWRGEGESSVVNILLQMNNQNIKSHPKTSAHCRWMYSRCVRGGGWFAMHYLAVLWPWT